MRNPSCPRVAARGHTQWLVIAVMAALVLSSAGLCAGQVVSAYHFPDTRFAQLEKLWQPTWTLGTSDESVPADVPLPLGGCIFVYFRNGGQEPVTVADLAYEGIKLSEGLGKSGDRQSAVDIAGQSILLSKLPKEQIDKLKAAGEPVWWKPEPRTVPPGGFGEVVLRLRGSPGSDKVNVTIMTDRGEIPATIDVAKPQPRFESISFHPARTVAYLYAKHPTPGAKVVKLLVDGADVTKNVRLASDPALRTAPIVYWPSKPFDLMSYHNFQAVYDDGSTATAGIRAWGSEFVYGMWGARGDAKGFYEELARHNVNAQMGHAGKDVTEMSLDKDGFDFLTRLGIRSMASSPGNARNPLFFFVMDEPDAHDPEIDELASKAHLGCLAQGLVGRMEAFRSKDSKVPILLNIDNTDTPQNWYTYHQLADVPAIDPYYPEQLDGAYRRRPGLFAARLKPSYVYAAARISLSSGAPKLVHVILCSTKYVPRDWKPGDYSGRFPTPEEKRIEVYYAIAGGAKGISYWWFSPDKECVGCGVDESAARALWREIGLLGAEVRTAGSVITMGCPTDLSITAPRNLVARALVSGLDTVALVLVNDEVFCDRVGTVFKPAKGTVSVRIPSWVAPKDAFEVTYQGVKDVNWKQNAGSVDLDLGPVELTRFVLITSDGGLRGQLDQLHKNKFAANVAALTAQQ